MVLACLLYPTSPTYFLSISDEGLVSEKKENFCKLESLSLRPLGVKIEAYKLSYEVFFITLYLQIKICNKINIFFQIYIV